MIKYLQKKIALKANVNCIPGINKEVKSFEQASKILKDIGLPVMIKASAGGGGKGMRIVYKKGDLKELLRSAKSEAKNAFGDDRIFIEKYIENPRHIEIQVLGDKYGKIISLGERECSIQRRHQKIIEEAPSFFLDESTRKEMGEQAVRLAKQVKYFSAGTVEFVVDKNRNFYFLEMNTRLQVEHPVTEEITGIDLVKEMIMIAQGEKISIDDNKLSIKGWAIEARLCSEDPSKEFLPSAGKIKKMVFPTIVRIDQGYVEGDVVSIYYDSLLAKIISKGSNRKSAINKLIEALELIYIRGVQTNQDFLINILSSDEFSKAKFDTNFISKKYKDGFPTKNVDANKLEIMVIAALTNQLHYLREINNDFSKISKEWILISENKSFEFKMISISEAGFVFDKNKKKFFVELYIDPASYILKIKINDNFYNLRVNKDENVCEVFYGGSFSQINIFRSSEYESFKNLPKNTIKEENNYLVSPMPGKVVDILVNEGDIIGVGKTLIILDAMKMENILKSETKVRVLKVFVKKDEAVSAEQNLIKLQQIR